MLLFNRFDKKSASPPVKITVKFLSNEIRPDAIDIIIYKKNCKSFENCQTFEVNNVINQELKLSILKNLAL